MKLRIRVDMGDGPFEVTTCLYDVVGWERRFKRKASQLADGIGAEDIAFLAYSAARTNGITMPAAFDDFVKKVVDIEVIDESDAFPTEEASAAS